MDIKQLIASDPSLNYYSHFIIKFRLIGDVPGITCLNSMLYTQIFASQIKLVSNSVMSPFVPQVNPFSSPFDFSNSRDYYNGKAHETISINKTNEVIYNYAITDFNDILVPELSCIENMIILMYHAFMGLTTRYSNYLSFEISIEHNSNAQVIFNSKTDVLESGVSSVVTYKIPNVFTHVSHLIFGDDIHRILEGLICGFSCDPRGIATPAYNRTFVDGYYKQCTK